MRKIIKKIIATTLVIGILVGCSSGPSSEAKKLYNEQVDIYQKYADYLKEALAEDEPTMQLKYGTPTKFFHLNDEEAEVWENADFGEEMQENLEKGRKIENDAKRLYDTVPSGWSISDEELEELEELFNELKEQYKDFDYTLKTY